MRKVMGTLLQGPRSCVCDRTAGKHVPKQSQVSVQERGSKPGEKLKTETTVGRVENCETGVSRGYRTQHRSSRAIWDALGQGWRATTTEGAGLGSVEAPQAAGSGFGLTTVPVPALPLATCVIDPEYSRGRA